MPAAPLDPPYGGFAQIFAPGSATSASVGPVRRILPFAAAAGVVLGATALAAAQGGQTNPYDQPEPSVTSGQVLHLPSTAGCSQSRTATVRVTPPPGAILGFVRIAVDG